MPADRRVLGPLDTDTAPEEVANGRSASLRNVQLERGYATTARGNVAVGAPLTVLPGVSTVVGACANPETDGVVWLQWNDAGLHRVAHWQPGMANPAVLLTWAGLNLPARRGLTHAHVLDGLLLFLDAAGEPRGVNLARAAAGEFTPALLTSDPYALHLVKQAPQVAPTAAREINADAADPRTAINRVADSAWQFAFQYEYPDGERTPLGPYSEVVPTQIRVVRPGLPIPPDDLRNFLRVPYPAGGLAPSAYVRYVRLLVRQGSETTWRVVGNMTPGVPLDFYGSTTGEALTVAEGGKLFEALPLAVGALTVADSRIFVGNCNEGYAPSWPAAGLTAVAGPSPVVPGTQITIYRTDTNYAYDLEDPNGGAPTQIVDVRRRYFDLASGTYPDPASTYRELRLVGGVYYPVLPLAVWPYATLFVDFTGDEVNNDPNARVVTILTGLLGGTTAPPPESLTLHERASYPVGVAFFDALNRTAGAEAVRSVPVPRQDYAAPVTQNLRWALDPAGPVPAWARSYQLLLGLNTTASYFLQFYAKSVVQFEGDNADGSPKLEPWGSNSLTIECIWVSLASLLDTARGYAFEAGDRLRFAEQASRSYDFPILYQRGGYVAIPLEDVSVNIVGVRPLIEIYRPAPLLESLVLYERGPRFPITAPGTPAAALSVTSGILAGDCAFYPFLAGLNAVPEAMLPDTSRLTGWLTPRRGRPIAQNKDGRQQRRRNLVRWGGVRKPGSQLNGLGNWDSLDQIELPLEAGGVVALRLAAQGQSEGRTLIAVQERGAETLYLGQTPISASIRQAQTQIQVQTDSVIGGSNPLRGDFGTRHPGSVVGRGGKLYWWCADQGEVCRYAADGVNGLNSQHECRALGQQWARDYAEADVVAGYDPRTQEYVLCFGATGTAPALTVRFSERADNGRGGFTGAADYQPEAVTGTSDTLYAVQGQGLWRFTDAAPRLNWFGRPAAKARASVWANAGQDLTKTWLAVVEEGGAPLWEVVEAATPAGQSTLAPAARMERLVDKWYGPLLLDRNSPGFTGTDAQRRALYEGVPLQSTTLLATVECSDTTPAARLVALSLEFTVDSGQTPA